MLDKRLEKKLRYILGQLITNNEENWSLSKIINILLFYSLTLSSKNPMSQDLLNSFLSGRQIDISESDLNHFIKDLIQDNL